MAQAFNRSETFRLRTRAVIFLETYPPPADYELFGSYKVKFPGIKLGSSDDFHNADERTDKVLESIRSKFKWSSKDLPIEIHTWVAVDLDTLQKPEYTYLTTKPSVSQLFHPKPKVTQQ